MKVPSFPAVIPAQFMPQSQFASLLPQANYPTQNLTQLLVAAAVQQQHQQTAAQLLAPNFGVSPFSAATSLANSISIAQQKNKAIVGNSKSSYRRSSRRRPQSSSDESDEEDAEMEMNRFSDEATLSPSFAPSRNGISSVSSSSANEPIDQRKISKKAPSARKIAENVSKVCNIAFN
jgi:hypothetical protein